MEMSGNKKTENNVYNEAYDDGNVDVQPKRHIREVNLSLFRTRSSIFWNRVFGIDIAVIHTDT